MDVQQQIRAFIAERFLFDAKAPIDPAQSLMKAGILDSTGAMELVMFLEETFQIKFADADLVPQNLDTINGIAAYLAKRRAGLAKAG